MIYTLIGSPIGELLVTGDGVSITGLYTPGHGRTPREDWTREDSAFEEVRTQLDEYFAGTRTEFDLPLACAGTAFQESVWKQLRAIPYGEVDTYGELAKRLGTPTASRAVGAANGRNPISIIVPCHRVIGTSGALTGYAGGVEAKQWLLTHERSHRPGGQLTLDA